MEEIFMSIKRIISIIALLLCIPFLAKAEICDDNYIRIQSIEFSKKSEGAT